MSDRRRKCIQPQTRQNTQTHPSIRNRRPSSSEYRVQQCSGLGVSGECAARVPTHIRPSSTVAPIIYFWVHAPKCTQDTTRTNKNALALARAGKYVSRVVARAAMLFKSNKYLPRLACDSCVYIRCCGVSAHICIVLRNSEDGACIFSIRRSEPLASLIPPSASRCAHSV